MLNEQKVNSWVLDREDHCIWQYEARGWPSTKKFQGYGVQNLDYMQLVKGWMDFAIFQEVFSKWVRGEEIETAGIYSVPGFWIWKMGEKIIARGRCRKEGFFSPFVFPSCFLI